MPSTKQITVDAAVTTRGVGSSDTETLAAAFPASPIHRGTITRDSVEKKYNALALTGVVKNGLGIASFDRDYTGVDSGVGRPDRKVATGGEGLPASPFVPNPSSPGPGSQNPKDMPKPPDGFGKEPNGDTYGTGTGALTNPKTTSDAIAGGTLGSWIMGKSRPQ